MIIFYAIGSMVAPLTPDPVPKQKSVDKQFVHKRPSAGAIVEASSNLYAIVKTTALTIFAASPLRKKSWDFFRLRSNSGVFSSSIFDCTAHNAAYCDAGNGTPQREFCLLLASKVGRGFRAPPRPKKSSLFRL